jgi:hypothetical protein
MRRNSYRSQHCHQQYLHYSLLVILFLRYNFEPVYQQLSADFEFHQNNCLMELYQQGAGNINQPCCQLPVPSMCAAFRFEQYQSIMTLRKRGLLERSRTEIKGTVSILLIISFTCLLEFHMHPYIMQRRTIKS